MTTTTIKDMEAWQSVFTLGEELREHLLANNLDTTFIDDKQREAWNAINRAYNKELLSEAEVEVVDKLTQPFQARLFKEVAELMCNHTYTTTEVTETDEEIITTTTTTTVVSKGGVEVLPIWSKRPYPQPTPTPAFEPTRTRVLRRRKK